MTMHAHAYTVQWAVFPQKLREACPNFSEGWLWRIQTRLWIHAANVLTGGAGGNSGMLFPGMPIALTSGSIFYMGNSIFRP